MLGLYACVVACLSARVRTITAIARRFFFKQKTAYEMRISDWSSDVCSSDLTVAILYSPVSNRERIPVSIGYRETQRATTIRVYSIFPRNQIGRASCRERVCQYV